MGHDSSVGRWAGVGERCSPLACPLGCEVWPLAQGPHGAGLDVLFAVIGVLLTETTSNTAAATMVVPVAMRWPRPRRSIRCSRAGGLPGGIAGFMRPVSTPPNHRVREWLRASVEDGKHGIVWTWSALEQSFWGHGSCRCSSSESATSLLHDESSPPHPRLVLLAAADLLCELREPVQATLACCLPILCVTASSRQLGTCRGCRETGAGRKPRSLFPRASLSAGSTQGARTRRSDPRPTTARLQAIGAQAHDMIAIGLEEKAGEHLYDSAILIDRDGTRCSSTAR